MPAKIRSYCLMLMMAWCAVLLHANNAAAQQVIVTMFTDFYVDGGLHVQVWMADQSDMSCCPGASHYNYFGGASISGTSGSDSLECEGYGPYSLFVPDPIGGEGDWNIDGGLSFECSVGGLLYGNAPTLAVGTYPFTYHYNNVGYDGDGDWGYIPKNPAAERRCKPQRIRWHQNSPDGLTIAGIQWSMPPVATICAGVCESGHQLFEWGLAGQGMPLDYCQHAPFWPEF
jgi:hypothetical protein